MPKPWKPRLSFANVMSSIAVLLALGGASAFAASHLAKNTVGTGQLKARSVGTAELRRAAVTRSKIAAGAVSGSKVDLATLGKVPSAARADAATRAANAADADAIAGQRLVKVDYEAPGGSAASTILDTGGLKLTASCATAADEVELLAETSKQESSIYTFAANDTSNPAEADREDGDFLIGGKFDLLAGGTGDIGLVHFGYTALDGTVATGTLVSDASFAAGECSVKGDVIIG